MFKFLNEINAMSRKGIYPSLSILLEEDDAEPKDDDSAADSSEDDFSFGDESETDSGDSDSESTDEPASPTDEPDIPDDSGITDAEKQSIEVDSQLKDIAQNLEMLGNDIDNRRYEYEFFPNASIVDNKIYNLKNFVILKEDDSLEDTLEKIDGVLNQGENKEKILKLKKKANEFQSGDANFQSKIPDLVRQTVSNIEHFDSLYDKPSIAANDMLDKIKKQSKPEDLSKNVEEYVYQLAKKLDKHTIKHALNVDATVDNNDFKNAKGGFNRS